MAKTRIKSLVQEQRPVRIAIVGGGAGSREFVIRFLEAGGNAMPAEFSIFEPRAALGRGIAWSDEGTPFLANMRVETLGPTYHEFELVQRLLTEIDHPEAASEYPSRSAMGLALDRRWQSKVNMLCAGQDPARHIQKRVVDLGWDDQKEAAWVRCAEDQSRYEGFDLVILALGNIPSKVPPALAAARVINGWDFSAIAGIGHDEDVLIKGAGLTAIDATMHLIANGHRRGKRSIAWHSRSGALPFIRPRQIKLNSGHLSYQNLTGLIEAGRNQGISLTLDRLARLFELEMRVQANENQGNFSPYTNWEGFLRCLDRYSDPANGREMLKAGMIGSIVPSLWFSVAKLLDEYTIPLIWNALPDAEKARFLVEWRREFDRFWAPIPAVNGGRIEEWLEEGTIQLLQTQIEYIWDHPTRKFPWNSTLEDPLGQLDSNQLRERYKNGFDVLIDAGGIAADLDKLDSELVSALTRKDILFPWTLPTGKGKSMSLGAQIDWLSGAVLDGAGEPHGWLYTLAGSLTIGAHRFTNSYLAVAASADRAARSLFLI